MIYKGIEFAIRAQGAAACPPIAAEARGRCAADR
jgi:hypothetical protein